MSKPDWCPEDIWDAATDIAIFLLPRQLRTSRRIEIIARALLAERNAQRERRLLPDDVEWVVNDIAELGVKIGDQFFFLYKGTSLVYGYLDEDPSIPPVHDADGTPMHWRPVFKREFGECAHPINYANPSLIGTVSLDDSDEWQELPAAIRQSQQPKQETTE